MKIINIEGPELDPKKSEEMRKKLLEFNKNYRENKGKIRDLMQYEDYITTAKKVDNIALNAIIIASLLAIYKLSFVNITSIPLLPEKIEKIVEKIEEVVRYLGLGSMGVSIITHTIANFFKNKAVAYGKEKGLSVLEIKKYFENKNNKKSERGI